MSGQQHKVLYFRKRDIILALAAQGVPQGSALDKNKSISLFPFFLLLLVFVRIFSPHTCHMLEKLSTVIAFTLMLLSFNYI